MNADKSMIIKYSYRTGNPVEHRLFKLPVKLVNVPLRILMDIQSAAPGIISWLEGYGVYLSSLYQGCGL